MKTQSTIKPPLSGFLIEQINGNKCNVHIYENVIYDGDIYEYDLYILKTYLITIDLVKTSKHQKQHGLKWRRVN